jgi:predicted MPP superfamily phosphohydrolase
VRWLQLSDLHVGKDNIAQRTAFSALISAIEQFTKGKRFDLIFLTGDLAFSGKKDEYVRLEQSVIVPLKGMEAFANARIFAVPGNHDLDCETSSERSPSLSRRFRMARRPGRTPIPAPQKRPATTGP